MSTCTPEMLKYAGGLLGTFIHFEGVRHNRHIEVSALVAYHISLAVVFPIPLARLLHMLRQAILKILKPI